MARRFPTLLIIALSASASLRSQQPGPVQQTDQHRVVRLRNFPLDQRFETVSGDPTKSGALYVIRIHSEPGYIVMPHTHQQDENIVVVKGKWALGMGDRFNRKGLEPMEVGTYGFVPKKMAHFGWSRSETVIQVHGMGPFLTEWVHPMYELTKTGILLETSGASPGRPTTLSPPDCFVLKLGSLVRGSYGTGRVVGALCTPGQLTQYRIEKPNGERFWGVREALKTQ